MFFLLGVDWYMTTVLYTVTMRSLLINLKYYLVSFFHSGCSICNVIVIVQNHGLCFFLVRFIYSHMHFIFALCRYSHLLLALPYKNCHISWVLPQHSPFFNVLFFTTGVIFLC
jgi:hypothetical protein